MNFDIKNIKNLQIFNFIKNQTNAGYILGCTELKEHSKAIKPS